MESNVVIAGGPTSNEVTVYNQDFAVVKEVRLLSLQEGKQSVAVTEVPTEIKPASVAIRSLSEEGSIRVLEQNYQYDLISPNAILQKSIDQRVRIVRDHGNEQEVSEGILLSPPREVADAPNGRLEGMVVKTDDGRFLLNPSGEVEVLTMPPGLIGKPTLLWEIVSSRAGENEVELSYQTGGMSWKADYVLTIDDEDKGDLNAWVTIDNRSGATFENTRLKLLAGDLNLIRELPKQAPEMQFAMMAFGPSDETFVEETLFEYHLYTLQRPATIRNRESKQLSLLEAFGMPVRKKLILDAMGSRAFFPSDNEVGTGVVNPSVHLEFANDVASGLGVPLPKGIVRLYQRDSAGSVQFLGEDRINHLPKNEKVSIKVGNSFDVVAERKRTRYKRISNRVFQETFEIEVRNRKAVPETVFVIERSWGSWNLIEQSHEMKQLDSHTLQFEVLLQPDEVVKVVYSIETRW